MSEGAKGSTELPRREPISAPFGRRFHVLIAANDNEGRLAAAFLRYKLWVMALVGGLGAGAVFFIGLGGG